MRCADLNVHAIAKRLRPVLPQEVILVTNGSRAHEAFTAAARISQIAFVASVGERMVDCYHGQNFTVDGKL